ncbi:unnamed protein product [Leuciscus chuanchicus]
MTCSEEAEAQFAEIELLLSMFPNEEELQVDELSHAELRAYVEGSAHTPPSSRPQFNIKLKVENLAVSITLLCTYPADYPKVLPDITVRCSELTRSQQMLLHSNLNTYLSENCRGDVCILSAVQWINENAQGYISKSALVCDPKKENVSMQSKETFTRLWIYSHHIYNKMKRKNILEWAKELNLSGFSMPGTPGIVCVEGLQSACDEFWARRGVVSSRASSRLLTGVESSPHGRRVVSSRASSRLLTGVESSPHGGRVVSSRASSRLLTGVESSPHGRRVVSSRASSRLLTGVESSPHGRRVVSSRASSRLLTGVESSPHGRRVVSSRASSRLLTGVESSPHGRRVVSSRASSRLLTGVESSPHGRRVVSSLVSSRLCTGVGESEVSMRGWIQTGADELYLPRD